MVFRDIFGSDAGASPRAASFDEIVAAQFRLDHDGERSRNSPRLDAADAEVQALWENFAHREGEIVSSSLGRLGETGAALTVLLERRRFVPGFLGRPRLHVALDLAGAGRAADLVSRYERLRVKADQLLKGAEREHVTRVLYDRICRVIRIVDSMIALDSFRSNKQLERLNKVMSESFDVAQASSQPQAGKAHSNQRSATRREVISDAEKGITMALQVASQEASQAEELCNRAVRRGAMIAYFQGMLFGIVVFSALGAILGLLLSKESIAGFGVVPFLTVFVAGAVGAVVSVMSRMSSGDSWLEYETARSYLRLLGMFRPLIGAIFGVALYFGIQSGMLEFIKPPSENHGVFFFYAFTAFLAGFSERWASDVLVPIRSEVRTEALSSHSTVGATSPPGARQ
jgi:hypothetical protein